MTRLTDLQDLRETLIDSIDASMPDKRAPLAAQLRATLAEIDELVGASEKASDPIDELASRRAARGAGTASHPRSTATNRR